MRPILDMDNIQIEITNACIHSCSNCTRFCGHQRPYFMPLDEVKRAIDSMAGYPKMTGIMGGEPLLHPDFEAICKYAREKIPYKQLGLWSCFPEKYASYGPLIVDTFAHVFLNDHTREDIYHAPILVASEEIYKDRHQLFAITEHCWIQEYWSAAINPRGAFFCEIAAALSILLKGGKGWPVEPGWWWAMTKDFKAQREEYCPQCGCALPFSRRKSTEEIDDISPGMIEKLRPHSLKVQAGKYVVSDMLPSPNPEPMAKYKDMAYRQGIAARYGIELVVNDMGFCSPLKKDPNRRSIFDEYRELCK